MQALCVRGADKRFSEVDEATSAILHFPGERIATFTTSFGTGDAGYYQVLGTKGDIRVDPGYTYHAPMKHAVTINGKTSTKTFKIRDQFAAELIYFSNCVLRRRDPEPNGFEGLADIRIIQALYESARTGERVKLERFEKSTRPSMRQQISRPPVKEPELVHAASPSGD
ncbi:MAG: Gfo/Idh/MocA family oxidoreductase [Pirellulales bacterium]